MDDLSVEVAHHVRCRGENVAVAQSPHTWPGQQGACGAWGRVRKAGLHKVLMEAEVQGGEERSDGSACDARGPGLRDACIPRALWGRFHPAHRPPPCQTAMAALVVAAICF